MNPRSLRLCSWFFVGSVAVLTITGFSTLSLPSALARGNLSLDEPVRSFGEVPSGSSFPVSFTLTNTTARPVQILGASSICTPQGCLKPAAGLPKVAPPHGSCDVAIDVVTRGSGVLVGRIVLFTDYNEKLKIPVEVTGRVVKPDARITPGERSH